MKMKSKLKTRSSVEVRRQNRLGYAFLSVWLVGFLIFTAYPLFYTVYLSFNDVALTVHGWEISFVGIENYITALLRNQHFTAAIASYLMMAVLYVPVIVVVSFILALFLNQEIKGRALFRTIYFLPVIVLSGSVMFQLMDVGGTHLSGVENLFIYTMIANFSPEIATVIERLFSNFSIILWFTGIPIVLYINGLQKINRQLFEAAQIDGATAWQILWKITLPIVRPVGLIVTIFTIVHIGTFTMINPVAYMVQGSIHNTIGGLGLASAFAWIYSILIIIMIGIAYLIFKEKREKSKQQLQKRQQQQLAKLRRYQKREAKKHKLNFKKEARS